MKQALSAAQVIRDEHRALAAVLRSLQPLVRMGPSELEAMGEAISEAKDGKLLAFCRTGNRSTLVWAVAQYDAGVPREELEKAAAGAGMDLSPVSHLL